MPELILSREGKTFFRVPLGEKTFSIGRHPENDLTLPDDVVSRKHAEIFFRQGSYFLKDSSKHGTKVDGSSVSKATVLKQGNHVQIGPWTLAFLDQAQKNSFKDMAPTKVVGAPTEQESEPQLKPTGTKMVGQSKEIKKVLDAIEKVAQTTHTVLVSGETGTGKELVARAIKDASPRFDKPYVILNCGAISPSLIESELFGHEKGAFTGALQKHLGAFEQAHTGTLFLDEIGELPLDLQPKLLRALENKTIHRVGGKEDISVDVRVIAATHRNIAEWVREGKFRQDLYFRLHVLPIDLPALRERKEDIPLLANHFISEASVGSVKKLSAEAVTKLQAYPWPGNIRELKNTILRSLIFCDGDVIKPQHIDLISSLSIEKNMVADSLNLDDVEKQKIISALKKTSNNKAQAAKVLGIAKSTLFKKINDYQLKV